MEAIGLTEKEKEELKELMRDSKDQIKNSEEYKKEFEEYYDSFVKSPGFDVRTAYFCNEFFGIHSKDQLMNISAKELFLAGAVSGAGEAISAFVAAQVAIKKAIETKLMLLKAGGGGNEGV